MLPGCTSAAKSSNPRNTFKTCWNFWQTLGKRIYHKSIRSLNAKTHGHVTSCHEAAPIQHGGCKNTFWSFFSFSDVCCVFSLLFRALYRGPVSTFGRWLSSTGAAVPGLAPSLAVLSSVDTRLETVGSPGVPAVLRLSVSSRPLSSS